MIKSPYSWLALYFLLCLYMIRGTYRFSEFTRTTLQVQILFMMIPFLFQPLILLTLNMSPSPGDDIADRRLLAGGDYSEMISELLMIVFISQLFYCLAIELYHYFQSQRMDFQVDQFRWSIKIDLLFLMVVLALITLVLSNYGVSNPVLFAIRKLAATSTCFGLIFYRQIDGARKSKLAFLILGGTVTIFETIEYGFTKAPILALGMSIWIFFLSRKVVTKTWRIVVAIVLGTILAAIFKIVQFMHLGPESNAQFQYVASRYPDWLSPALPFLQRFDLMRSLTDAYYAGIGTWLSVGDYFREFYSAFFWNYGFEGMNFGARWAKEVSSKSVSGNAYTGVSLSQGPIAEGYIIAGILGSIIASFLVALFTLFLCEKSRRSRFVAFVAVDMFAKNSLFEQGLIGNAERLTGALKILLIFIIFEKLLHLTKSQIISSP